MSDVVFKPFDETYMCDSNGNIYKNGKKKKLNKGMYGYLRTRIHSRMTPAHRVIAMAFVERPEHLKDIPFDELEVDHINTIRDDNRPCNLRWCTTLENHNNPITRERRLYHLNGERHPFYGRHHTEESKKKISEAQKGKAKPEETRKSMAKTVYVYSETGELLDTVYGYREFERKYKISRGALSNHIKNKKPYKGYLFKI